MKDCVVTASIFRQAWGLMFSRPRKEWGLVFDFRCMKHVDLHMLFVFYPIDVLFLDDKKVVVEIKEDFKPFRYYAAKKKCRFVCELPTYSIRSSGTHLGHKIKF
ncbi:DUF192 domain-containing protein [Candidatus Woesearchaeota archaeon]|nr:DUF192 domain-containing protein [Candidatus Woesearchaeota archaeon]